MNEVAFLSLLVIICGAATGSFAAVLAERLPLGEDVTCKPSACRACKTNLYWRDKIPILSYLLLNGHCRNCGTAIPRRLFYAEIFGAMLGIVAVILAETPLHMLIGAGYLWCLMALAMCDLSAFRLPDALTGTLFAFGLTLAWENPARSISEALISAGAGVMIFMAIRIAYQMLRGREGLGFGDVKLTAGICAGLGLQALPIVALVAALAALLATVVLSRRSGQQMNATLVIPFGAYLSAATALVWALT